MVIELIKREVEALNGQHEKVFVCGFSQGCAIALAAFLLYPDGRLGGCFGGSGSHALELDYASEVNVELKKQSKIMLYSGENDPMSEKGEDSYQELTEQGLNFTFEKEPGCGHGLTDIGKTKIAIYLHEMMGEPYEPKICLLYTSPSPRDRG